MHTGVESPKSKFTKVYILRRINYSNILADLHFPFLIFLTINWGEYFLGIQKS